MRTKLKGLLTGMMVFVMMLAGAMVVQAASGSVTFGSSSYTKTEGEEFNVGVYVKGDVDIATYNFYITYDEEKIEYVSGADSGGSGRLSFAGSMSSDSRQYKKIWLTFKAKAAGEFTMSVTDVYLGPLNVANGDSLSVSKKGSAPITIKAAGSASGDCDLKSISIAETGFYGFSADKTQYDITVENKYEKLTVTAKAADSNATVEISDTTLKVGTNYIKIKVTAQSGDTKTYTVIVRRKAGTTDTTTTPTETTTPQEPPTIPGVDNLKSYYSYNDNELYFTENLDGVTVPEGFEKVKVTVEGQEYEVLTNSNGTIVLYYLVDASGQNGSLYVYSSAKDAVYPYVVLSNSDHVYMVDEVENPQVPEGYQKVNMVIKGAGGAAGAEASVIAWYHEDAPNFYLLYASCNGGNPELYQYDVNENTIQRFNGIKGTTQIVEGNDDSAKVKELEEKVEKLEKDKKSEAKTWMLVVIVLAVLCIILVVIVVALFYKMRDQMEYESYDDDDDNDDGDYVVGDDDRTAPRTEKKNVKTDFDDDDDFTFFDMDDDR